MISSWPATLALTDLDSPHLDRDLRRFTDLLAASSRAEWGDAETPWSFAELRSAFGNRANWDYRLLLAWVEAEVVGGLWLRMPIRDNRHLVNAEVTVAPRWRRRGVGSALLTELDQQVEALGRTTIVVAAHRAGTGAANRADPLNEPPDPRTATLAERFGYTRAQVERRSSLTVPLDRRRRIAAEADVNRYLDGYRLLTWVNEIPPEQLTARARLSEAMSVDVPLGELQLGPQAWDAARIANVVDEAVEQGRTFIETAAQDDATGALVAFTDLVVPAHGNGNAYQWDTFVDAGHRGRRLGLAVKLANLAALERIAPAVRRVITWNAHVNAPMLRINAQLGFRADGQTTEWQKMLA